MPRIAYLFAALAATSACDERAGFTDARPVDAELASGAVHLTWAVVDDSDGHAVACADVGAAFMTMGIRRSDSPLGDTEVFGCGSAMGTVELAPGSYDFTFEMTGGGVQYSFEAIGLKATAEQAFQMLRRGGTATVIGMIPPGTMVEVHGPDFLWEKKLQGSMMGSNRFRVDMPRFVDFYLAGKLHLDDMISRRIKLADVNAGLKALETGEVARSVIMFN